MRIKLADWCCLHSPRKYKKTCEEAKRYAMHYVDHPLKEMKENREESALERYPFILDLYRELRDRILVRPTHERPIAGRDTAACLMSWSM